MYLSWAPYYEGDTDAAYFDILVPRVLDSILLLNGTRPITVPDTPALRLGRYDRSICVVAAEICAGKSSFHLVFIHADTGGRALEANTSNRQEAFALKAFELCQWPPERIVKITPRHETEAWALADPAAVCSALGFQGNPNELNLPENAREAERLTDPKLCLDLAARAVSRRRYRAGASSLLTAIAQEQRLDFLRQSRSFQEFELELCNALRCIGCLPIS